MGRRQAIFVDENALLARIGELTTAELAALKAAADEAAARFESNRGVHYGAWATACDLRGIAAGIEQDGIRYDLEQFAGRPLTASERIRFQQALRRLHDAGLIVLNGGRATRVKVTPEGWNAIHGKPAAAIANANLS